MIGTVLYMTCVTWNLNGLWCCFIWSIAIILITYNFETKRVSDVTTQTNKPERQRIAFFKLISLQFSKTMFLKRKLCLHSLNFSQSMLMLSEPRRVPVICILFLGFVCFAIITIQWSFNYFLCWQNLSCLTNLKLLSIQVCNCVDKCLCFESTFCIFISVVFHFSW